MRTEIQTFIGTHPCGKMIRLVGRIEPAEMPAFLSQVDVFIAASHWPENQPLTIMEAMACSIPVVASNCGGIPELISNDATGKLVPPKDPVALCEALNYYILTPEKMHSHGEAARTFIETHDMRTTISKLQEIYTSLLLR